MIKARSTGDADSLGPWLRQEITDRLWSGFLRVLFSEIRRPVRVVPRFSRSTPHERDADEQQNDPCLSFHCLIPDAGVTTSGRNRTKTI